MRLFMVLLISVMPLEAAAADKPRAAESAAPAKTDAKQSDEPASPTAKLKAACARGESAACDELAKSMKEPPATPTLLPSRILGFYGFNCDGGACSAAFLMGADGGLTWVETRSGIDLNAMSEALKPSCLLNAGDRPANTAPTAPKCGAPMPPSTKPPLEPKKPAATKK